MTFQSELLDRKWLSEEVFALELTKPRSFSFTPGQRISIAHDGLERDYSLISTPDDPSIALCIRQVEAGRLSALLARTEMGTPFHWDGPKGHFVFRSSSNRAVFIATGTGVAPFVAMARSGVTGFVFLHGAAMPEHLYYESVFRPRATRYVPCLSGNSAALPMPDNGHRGHVSTYLKQHLADGVYDFYLCGRSEMILDVTTVIDERFPDSRVYTERFS